MVAEESGISSSANSPGILIIGSPDVGKRTLISRLLNVDFGDAIECSPETNVHGWIIDTKYYTADVSVFMAHLRDGFSINTIPGYDRLAALVMVFDISHIESFVALQNWIRGIDIAKHDILLCIANKIDLDPDHLAHTEYKRKLLKRTNISDALPELSEFGISEAEGRRLLGDEVSPEDINRPCFEWCLEHNIEYIEACASNVEFDKCLSVSGDSQGVERVFGALSAHMWPGMILKSRHGSIEAPLSQQESSGTEDSDYEVGYELLSPEGGDDEGPCPPDNVVDFGSWTSGGNDGVVNHFESEDMDRLMAEIGNMRENLRLMPDFQRRQIAAELATRVATMLGDAEDNPT